MKTITKCLVLLFLPFSLHARETPSGVGFVRIVNAISPGTGNASFIVNGKNLFADGYAIGQTTGGYGVGAGSMSVEVKKEGLEKGTTKQALAVGETITFIAFAEKLPVAKEGDPPKWTIKLLLLKQKDVEKGFGLAIVSVSNADEVALTVDHLATDKSSKVFAKRMTITPANMGGSGVSIKSGDKVLTLVSPDSRGNYVVIVFDNAEGQLEATNFYDPKFVVAG